MSGVGTMALDMSVRYPLRVYQGTCVVHIVSHAMCRWHSNFNNKNGVQRIANEFCGISPEEMLLLGKEEIERIRCTTLS